MAEVTNELMFEVLQQIRPGLGTVSAKIDEVTGEVQVRGGHVRAIQQDVHNIHGVLDRHVQRLQRMERRLDLTDVPTP